MIVRSIDVEKLNEYGLYLVNEYPRTSRRKSYVKEFQLLHVILVYYHDNLKEGYSYQIPSFKHVRKMTQFVPKSDGAAKFLTPQQAVRFLDELKKEQEPQFFDVALTQYYLGLRIGEALGVMVEVIDFDEQTVVICRAINWAAKTWVPRIQEYPKGKKPRTIPAAPELLEAFRRIIEVRGKGLLFQDSDGIPLNRKTISTAFNRVLRRLGFKHVSGTHFVRKTSGTHAKMITGDIDAVSRYLGHSSSRVTRLYVGEIDEQKTQIANGLGNLLRKSVKVKNEVGVGYESSVVPQRPALAVVK
jgi:integrase